MKEISKNNIWTSIKNIFNNSPYASFTYPILYILVAYILGGIIAAVSASSNFENTFLIYISLIFMLSTYLTPIWVFVGLIVSKKETIYFVVDYWSWFTFCINVFRKYIVYKFRG